MLSQPKYKDKELHGRLIAFCHGFLSFFIKEKGYPNGVAFFKDLYNRN
jgi:hypothetical protein